MEKHMLVKQTDCRDCIYFYSYRCNLQLGKNHIWEYCKKFKPRKK